MAACIAAYNDADFIAMPAALASLVSGMFAAYKGNQWRSYEEPKTMRGLLKKAHEEIEAQKREVEQSKLQ